MQLMIILGALAIESGKSTKHIGSNPGCASIEARTFCPWRILPGRKSLQKLTMLHSYLTTCLPSDDGCSNLHHHGSSWQPMLRLSDRLSLVVQVARFVFFDERCIVGSVLHDVGFDWHSVGQSFIIEVEVLVLSSCWPYALMVPRLRKCC